MYVVLFITIGFYDLATDIGNPLNIHSYPPNKRGTEILVDKATYYIVYTEPFESKVCKKYLPTNYKCIL